MNRLFVDWTGWSVIGGLMERKPTFVFLSTGSHFLSHADWGCMDRVHCAWLVVEVDNKEEARMVAPPQFRSQTKIVALSKFDRQQIEAVVGRHEA